MPWVTRLRLCWMRQLELRPKGLTVPTIFTHGIRLEVAQDALGSLVAQWSEAVA